MQTQLSFHTAKRCFPLDAVSPAMSVLGVGGAPQVSFQQHQLPVQRAPAKAPVHVLPGAQRALLPCHHAPEVPQPQPQTLEARRLVAKVGEAPAVSKSAARTLRFADEAPNLREMSEPLPLQMQRAAPKSVLRRTQAGSERPATLDTAEPSASAPFASAPSECTALACPSGRCSRSSRDANSHGLAKPDHMPASRRRQLPEPELLVVKFLYLSRLPTGSWMQSPAQYQLSLHVGEDARSDPPDRAGPFSTPLVWPCRKIWPTYR